MSSHIWVPQDWYDRQSRLPGRQRWHRLWFAATARTNRAGVASFAPGELEIILGTDTDDGRVPASPAVVRYALARAKENDLITEASTTTQIDLGEHVVISNGPRHRRSEAA